MAEFCVECWNKIMDSDDPPKKFILSRERDICEECGEMKRCIIRVRRGYLIYEALQEIRNRARR